MSESKRSERLAHAQHNERACQCLDDGGFTDWVATTAFYAANHYVRYKVFPLTVTKDGRKVTYNSFEEYCRPIRRPSRHAIITDLAFQHCKPIAAKYKWLLDLSMTARYNNFKISQRAADKAKRYMMEIGQFCSPTAPTAKTHAAQASIAAPVNP